MVAGAWAYSTSFAGVFALDDVRAIVRNPTIRTLWPLSVPLSPPPQSTVAGRPIANLSFAVSYAFGGAPDSSSPLETGLGAAPDATPFHAVNLLIHLAAALVLFGVARRTLISPPLAAAAGAWAPWLAGAIALLWAVHPLQTAAVTYVVQRVESLMGLFYLLTLYCAIRAHDGSRRAWAWTAASWCSCAAGMATKEVMVTAPVVVTLWGFLFARPASGRTSRATVRLAVGLAATWIIFAVLVWHEHRGPSISFDAPTAWTYLLTQAGVVVHYLRLAFAPTSLAFLYDWPLAASLSSVAWQAALLGGLLALTVYLVIRRHPAGFVGAWFFLILAPTSTIVPILTEVAAEHRMYLPLAAVIAAVVMGVFAGGRRLRLAPRPSGAGAAVAVVLAAALLGAATHERNRVYGSAGTLWQDAVSVRPNDARPRVAFAEALAADGRLADAEAQLVTALTIAPDDPVAHVRLGVLLARQREFDKAVPHLERALAIRPGDIDAHRWLAQVLAAESRDRQAVEHYEQALTALPDDLPLLAGLATILADSSDPSVRNPLRAKALAARATQLTGGRDPRVLQILSAAQAGSGELPEAAATARTAAGLARAAGDAALASALDYRASAYEAASRPPLPAHR